MNGWLRRWGLWLLLVLVLGAGLAIGLQRSGNDHQSLEQRTLSIAGDIRCPVCQGESAAGSNTDASMLIRNTIRADLIRGQSKQQILDALEARYGSSILESPPKSGPTLLAWCLPVAITALLIIGLALGFRHWRRNRPAGSDRRNPTTPGGTGTVSAADEALVRDALARHPGRGTGRR